MNNAQKLLSKILADRVKFWTGKDNAVAAVYETAATLVELAQKHDIETLRQYDYYGGTEND